MSHSILAQDAPQDGFTMLQPEWQQVIGGYGLDKASAGLVLDDGRIMIAGESTADEDAVNADGVVIALSPDGNILWQRQYGDAAHDTAHGIVAAGRNPENGFFVIGDRSTAGGDNLWMLRIGPAGEERWRRDLPDDEGRYNRYIFNMPQREDGGFYAVGQARDREDRLHTRGFIMRFDAEGNIIWQRKYGQGQSSVLHNVRLLPDGGLLGIGRTNDTIDKHAAGWVIRLDEDGDILWEKKYGDYIFQQLRSAIAGDDGFVIAGDVVPENDAPQRGWVLKLGPDGEFVDERLFAAGYDQYCYDILERAGGGYALLCDMDHRADGQTDRVALRFFDAEGRLARAGIVSGGGDDTAFRLFATPDQGIAVLGTTTSRPLEPGAKTLEDAAYDYDIWIFKIFSEKGGP